KLLSRNACRNPWQNDVDVSVGQSLKAFGQQNLQLRLDVINFGNLLNKRWGWQNFSDQNNTCGPICSATTLLTEQGNLLPAGLPAGTTSSPLARGIYNFNKTMKPGKADNASANYRMQLSLRYSFYQQPMAAIRSLRSHQNVRMPAGFSPPAFFLSNISPP